jgi:hypothetical protein
MTEAAAAVALMRGEGVPVLGTGLAGPGRLADAITAALAGNPGFPEAVWSASDGSLEHEEMEASALSEHGLAGISRHVVSRQVGYALATTALMAVVDAAEAVRRRQYSRVLIVATHPEGFAASLLLGEER